MSVNVVGPKSRITLAILTALGREDEIVLVAEQTLERLATEVGG